MPDLPVYVPRASPVACLADISDTLYSVLRLLRTHRWIGALRVVVVLRYQHEESTRPEQTLGAQAKNAIICVIACLQSVKLLCCTGMGWTKTLPVIYVLSWLAELLLRWVYSTTPEYVRERILRERGWIATDLDEHLDPDRPWITSTYAARTRYMTARKRADLASASNTLVLGVQATSWLQIVYSSLPTAIDEWSNPFARPFFFDTMFFVRMLFCFVSICGTSFVAAYYPGFVLLALDHALDAVEMKHPNVRDILFSLITRRWSHALLIFMMVYIPTCVFYPDLWLPIIFFAFKRTARFKFAWTTILLTIYLRQIVLGILLSLRMQTLAANRASRQATRNTPRYVAFLVVQILVTLLYYWRLYNEKTTHKPSWTDWLGCFFGGL